MFLFASTVFAQEGGTFAASLVQFVPFILIFVVFYFLLIRPQQKKQKEHQALLNGLQSGDKVVTNGGIHGKVTKVGDTVITVEIAEKVRIQLDRQQVARLVTEKKS